nr:hypothetical protein CFP56_09289 [Quercus suber]
MGTRDCALHCLRLHGWVQWVFDLAHVPRLGQSRIPGQELRRPGLPDLWQYRPLRAEQPSGAGFGLDPRAGHDSERPGDLAGLQFQVVLCCLPGSLHLRWISTWTDSKSEELWVGGELRGLVESPGMPHMSNELVDDVSLTSLSGHLHHDGRNGSLATKLPDIQVGFGRIGS